MNSRKSFVLIACIASSLCAASALAGPITFPDDGTNQLVNVIRRYDDGAPLFTLGGGTPSQVFDGGHSAFQWNGVTTSAGTVLQLTLDQIYPLRKFVANYSSPWLPSGGYDISVSTTGFGSLTSVASSGATPGATQMDTLGSAVNAKYIQYTFFGPSAGPGSPDAVIFNEFQAFADATAGLQSYNANGSFNVLAVQGNGPISTTNLTSNWIDSPNNVKDLNINTYLRGASSGDAQFLLDLGSVHMVESIGLGFFSGQSWANGIKIETSKDNVAFTTVWDVGSSVSSSHLNIPDSAARYFRVTDKGGSGGALTEMEVFAAPLPELASTPAEGDTLDFGERVEFSTTTGALQLKNVGELASKLQINSFTITGPDSSVFSLPDFAPLTLTAGGIDTALVNVSATMGEAGNFYTALLTFNTNLGDILFNLQAQSVPIPEPSALLLVGCGTLALVAGGRRRRK